MLYLVLETKYLILQFLYEACHFENYLDSSRFCNSVTQPLYLSCTVTTGTPTSSYMLLKNSFSLHSDGSNLLIPGTSQADIKSMIG